MAAASPLLALLVILLSAADALLHAPQRPRVAHTIASLRPRATRTIRAAEAVPGDCTASITVRETKDRGLGVFATAPINNGTFLTDYVGKVVPSEELLRDHPDAEPEYAFRVDDALYIDAENSTHWSKRMNHNALAPNVDFEVTASPPRVRFATIRDVQKGEELTFDYGTEFWDGRSYSPDASTDGRVYASPTFCESVDLGVPLSEGALRDVLRARASRAEKVAALRRALDYFGISGEIEVPPSRFFRWRGARRVDAAQASPRQLARALRVCLAWD